VPAFDHGLAAAVDEFLNYLVVSDAVRLVAGENEIALDVEYLLDLVEFAGRRADYVASDARPPLLLDSANRAELVRQETVGLVYYSAVVGESQRNGTVLLY